MMRALISLCLRNRPAVILLFIALAALGTRAVLHLDIDAFPDTTPVQVQVNAVAPSLTPPEIEQQIINPVEAGLGGLPGLVNVRSVSKFGFGQVVATFDEHADMHLARQLVGKRLREVELPEGIDPPTLGPISTGLGEVFHYIVRSDDPARSLASVREIHDWVIKPELRKVRGVAEINAWGGFVKQFHVVVDPMRLASHGLELSGLEEALRRGNRAVGGGQVTTAGETVLVQAAALAQSAEEIGRMVVAVRGGAAVTVADVAEVREGAEIRRGAASANGRGEVLLGLGFMLMGENSHAVTRALKQRLEEVRRFLPEDILVETFYDRTELVDQVIHTIRENLMAGALLVTAVLFAFLGNLRAGLIVAASIPLCFLFASSYMLQAGIAASLLSLGAMDFGLTADNAVIIVENCMRRLRHGGTASRIEVVRDATMEVRKPALFGELIMVLVFVPLLALEGVEGRMFRPMALTMIATLLGSMILSVTLTPVLASLLLPRIIREREPLLVRIARSIYEPVLNLVLKARVFVALLAAVIVAAGGWGAMRLGREFLPHLGEGASVCSIVRLAGVSLEEAVRGNTRIEKLLLENFPDEVARVWTRVGTAETATDPMGIELSDTFIALHPRKQWTKASTQAELVAKFTEVIHDIPGMTFSFTQPIQMRMNEMVAGIRSDVGVKIYNDDIATLEELSEKMQRILAAVPGAADVTGEQITGQPVMTLRPRAADAARLGFEAGEILDWVQTLGGLPAGHIRQGQRTFPLMLRLPAAMESDPDALRNLTLRSATGSWATLGELADIQVADGASTLTHEWGRRRTVVQVNVRGRDTGSFVREAMDRVARELKLPEGSTLEWGGQFENLQRAEEKLMVVVPVTFGLILVMLLLATGSFRDVVLIATGIPLGLVGGVAALHLRGMPFTVSAAVGFIALSGVAILNGLVLVSFIRQRMDEGLDRLQAVREGCQVRLRPVLMTALVGAIGFVPMALNTGVGAEVQSPLATVVIGGILSNTLLTLVVLPVLYSLWGTRREAG